MAFSGDPRLTVYENIVGFLFAALVSLKIFVGRRPTLPLPFTFKLASIFILASVISVLFQGLVIEYGSGQFPVTRLLTLVQTGVLGYLVFIVVYKHRSVEPVALGISLGILINLVSLLLLPVEVGIRAGVVWGRPTCLLLHWCLGSS